MNGASKTPRFDDVDRRIVAALQADPRASWSQLGGVTGVSETTVLRRVQRLRDSGSLVIVAAPDALRCGFGQPVLLHFRTVPGEGSRLAHYLAERDDVRYVSLLTGRSDVMCELITPDHGYLSRVLMHDLPDTKWVTGTRTEIVLKRFKTRDQWSHTLLDGAAAPLAPDDGAITAAVPEKGGQLDAMDIKLLAALGPDGRRSYADLSHELGLSETAVARRVNALTAAHRLYFVAMVDPAALGFEFEVMLHIRVELARLESIALALAAMTEVRYVSATTGDSDLAVDAIFRDANDLYEFMTHTLARIPGVREVELDVVLESIKREYRYPLFSAGAPTSAHPLALAAAARMRDAEAPHVDVTPSRTKKKSKTTTGH
ncbi:Lrp/AsnC family transcriptional regulator [Rugosimonospora africana]|uniref:AsnC family transcriptional regulator n=1 Tax=Rugosimonospora africana TaxID=556532 RepID=A0A8J3VWS5_9ACTN|nr:Lrp/AsnC family transcriptional regulator [Rugosimonospora africana]GIH21204.1 AsnC family transcriptional regulator [Rugosimonospora africana]